MTAAQFKKDSKVTYVLVKGAPCGIVVPDRGSAFHPYRPSRLKYSGYIEVPYSYEDFIAFNENQRKAICQAELSKSGWCILIEECNPDSFFEEE